MTSIANFFFFAYFVAAPSFVIFLTSSLVWNNDPTLVSSVLERSAASPSSHSSTKTIVMAKMLHPEMLRSVFPAIRSNHSNAAVEQVMPLHPKNTTEAFLFGQLAQQLKHCRAENDSNCATTVLKRAQEIAGRVKEIHDQDLEDLEATIRDLDSGRGPFGRMFGWLSLVNIVWFIAILGIGATLLPFLGFLFEPILKFLEQMWTKLILPVLTFLMKLLLPFLGVFLYALALWAAVESSRYPLHDVYSMSGTMVAVLSTVLFGSAWAYTTIQLPHFRGKDHFEIWLFFTCWFFATYCGFLAILHQSTLIGYFSVSFLLIGLGFSMFSTGVSTFLGFPHEDQIGRGIATCLLLNVIMVTLALFGYDTSRYVAPFRSAVGVFGTSLYFFAFLIVAFWKKMEGQYAISVVLHLVAGELLGLQGMANVAKVYGALYLLVTFLIMVLSSMGFITGAFFGFVVLYLVASFLSTNPEYISYATLGGA